MTPVPVGIALGSNMGVRCAELNAGMFFLRSLSVTGEIRQSQRIETKPVDCPPDSDSFLNAVVELEIDSEKLPPRTLLKLLSSWRYALQLYGLPFELHLAHEFIQLRRPKVESI